MEGRGQAHVISSIHLGNNPLNFSAELNQGTEAGIKVI